RRVVKVKSACHADLRVLLAEGMAAEERHGLAVCGSPVVVLRPGWTTAETPDPALGKQTAR
ncbi:MAG TPA: hypothetical protein VE684_21815, partial [Crenalkalicoccus sp.]|nr:hypothetical protein [Crenalkalicoccus sp.]